MIYKIGVYGSNIVESEHATTIGKTLGKVLAENGCIVVTGACSGLPYIVAYEAAQHGTQVWGFSPELDAAGQKRAYPSDDMSIYTRLVYVPEQYQSLFLQENIPSAQDLGGRLKYRNVISTINSDAGILIAGGWGTLNEFTNLIYDGKPVGVLTNTGGLADELPKIYPKLRRKSQSIVIFDDNPDSLVARLIAVLDDRG